MAGVSAYLENALLNATLRNVPYTSPAQVYIALYTTNPTAADSGTEVTGGSYARATVAFGAPANGSCSNTADVNITGMPAITVSYMAIRDAATGGHLLFYGALQSPKTTNAGDTWVVRAGDLNVALS